MLTVTGMMDERDARCVHALVQAEQTFNQCLAAASRRGIYVDMDTTAQDRRRRTSYASDAQGAQVPTHSVVMGEPPSIALTIYKPVQVMDSKDDHA